ncbi:MAG: SusD/RagB family nutrient-binding outer membrane lipoprotein [Bacteroidales bacterium]|nr:SusD/RagB family nutrient-binding outer membrane lipoprotein [Bacteroidales bacterium]
MKKIHIILLFLIGMSITISCTKNFDDFNTDKKRAVEVPGQFLFANAQKALADQYSNTNVNRNNWKLFAQYWTETTYTDEANYDVVNRNIGNTLYRYYYRDILLDLKEARRLVNLEVTEGDAAAATKQNKLYLIDLVEVYAYNQMVDIFGDIPYTEALDIENISPVYDDAFAIYQDLLARAKAAADGLDANNESFGGDDLMMGGDVAMWKKFANTLIVKMGITLSTVDAAMAKSYVEGAYANAFGPGERCEFAYPGAANSNPLFQDLIQSGRHDFVPANTIVDLMNGLTDPRLPKYFEINGDTYRGGVYGESSAFSQYSHVCDRVQAENYAAVMLDYTDLAFYLAEAAERGFSVGGSAATWYENGVNSSMEYWEVDAADAAAYLAQANVAYATAPGDWKQKIGTQAWLAFYVRGLEGWTSYRRLGYPVMNIPPSPAESANGAVPRRHTYAINEQTLNKENFTAAAAKIGGDELSTNLFWDK